MATSYVDLAVDVIEFLACTFFLFQTICVMAPPQYRWFAVYTAAVVLLILAYPPFGLF